VEVRIAQLQGVAPSQRLKIVRQVCGSGHQCALDERRDHPDVPPQCCGNFMPDEVFWIIYPPLSIGIGERQPLPPDEGDQDIARTHSTLDNLNEVETGLNAINIHEHVVAAKVFS
jgi:hypothetical protein